MTVRSRSWAICLATCAFMVSVIVFTNTMNALLVAHSQAPFVSGRSLLRDFGKGAAIASKRRGFAGELLPTANDDIDVFGFEFDQAGFPVETLAGNQGRAGTAKRIEDAVAGTTAIANGSFYELNRLHSRMQIIDGGLGDRPDIALISISAPIMGPAGFPAIENRFVLTLVIGATERESIFGPNQEGRPMPAR